MHCQVIQHIVTFGLSKIQEHNGCNFAICYNTIDTNDPLLNRFYAAASIDEDYMKIFKVVACGHKRGEMRRKVGKLHPAYFLSYMLDTLRIVKDDKNCPLLFVEDRVFVPKSERIKTMEYLHLPHMGFANTFSLARSRYLWEGMKMDLEKYIERCGPYIEFQDCWPFKVELAREQLISAPMEWLGVDLFYFQGSHFLFIVNGFSQFCFYHKFGPSPSSLQVVNVIYIYIYIFLLWIPETGEM